MSGDDVSPDHTHAGAEEHYVGEAAYWDTHSDCHLPDAPFKAEAILRVSKEALVGDTPREALELCLCDVGCGAGGVLAGLAGRLQGVAASITACGYDVSDRALQVARRHHPDIQFRHGTGRDVLSGWDLIPSCDVFEHIEDPYAFLRSLLGKSRFYAFHIPLDLCAESVIRQHRLMHKFRETGHIHQYCATTALETLRAAGFAIVDWQYVDKWHHAKSLGRVSLKTQVLRWPERLLFRLHPGLKVAIFGGASIAALAADPPPSNGATPPGRAQGMSAPAKP